MNNGGAGGSIIEGLSIVNFTLNSGPNTDSPNGGVAIIVEPTSPNVQILGNYLGVEPDGCGGVTVGPNAVGVAADAAGLTVGGTAAVDRNIISGNTIAGVAIATLPSTFDVSEFGFTVTIPVGGVPATGRRHRKQFHRHRQHGRKRHGPRNRHRQRIRRGAGRHDPRQRYQQRDLGQHDRRRHRRRATASTPRSRASSRPMTGSRSRPCRTRRPRAIHSRKIASARTSTGSPPCPMEPALNSWGPPTTATLCTWTTMSSAAG